jgi:hypothetical protein
MSDEDSDVLGWITQERKKRKNPTGDATDEDVQEMLSKKPKPDESESEWEEDEGDISEDFEFKNTPYHDDSLKKIVLGTRKQNKEFEKRFENFGPSEWFNFSQHILQSKFNRKCSNEELLTSMTAMHSLFCFPYKDLRSVADRIGAIYNDVRSMDKEHKKMQRQYTCMRLEIEKRMLNDKNHTVGQIVEKRLNNIGHGIHFTFQNIIHLQHLRHASDKCMQGILGKMSPLTFFKQVDRTKLKPKQLLLEKYYRDAFAKHFRKYGDGLYQPHYNTKGQYTYSFEHVMSIEEFVYSSLHPLHQNQFWFQCLTNSRGNAAFCIEMISKLETEWVPTLVKHNKVMSYDNGLFATKLVESNGNEYTAVFFYFDRVNGKMCVDDLLDDYVAFRHIDIDFDEEGMDAEMGEGKERHYLKIKLEPMKAIYTEQRFSVEEGDWVSCFLGRMLHDVGEFDSWGVFLFLIGVGGTGKSTLLRWLGSLFDPVDVGILSNALQRTFALDGLHTKRVFFGLDVDNNFSMDQATMQSVACGEETSIVRKFKKPLTVVWKVHGGFAGNRMPDWQDQGGNLARRFIFVEFSRLVGKMDPTMFTRCLSGRDRFTKIITCSYFDKVKRFGGRHVKEVMPPKFKATETKMIASTNSLYSFVLENCNIDKNTNDQSMLEPFKNFRDAYKVYCRSNSYGLKPLKNDVLTGVFAKFQVKIINPAQKDKFNQSKKYLLGLSLKPGTPLKIEDS